MSCKLLAAVSALALAGCQSTPAGYRVAPQAGSLDAGFGEVSKYNAAVQTIDPDPVYTADGAQPGDHGEKAAEAAKRYRTGNVKDTEAVPTSDRGNVGTGGGPQ